MLTKNYQLNIEKSDGTTENISIEIPLKVGTYDVKYTLGTGNAISAGTIVVNETENTYNLNVTLSDNEVKTVQIKTPVALTFANATWEQIAQVSESGNASSHFAVGDEKTIQLSTGEAITLVILGFNHDDFTSGGKAGMSIGMKNLLATTYRMNTTKTNAGGWDESEMRTTTMQTLLGQLPSDLQAVIKSVNKKATSGGLQTTIKTSSDKLFLFSEVEIDGTTSSGYADEGEQYEYWKTVKDGTLKGDRIKYLSNGSGSALDWWLRSPAVNTRNSFRYIGITGILSSFDANYACGMSFGFCV